MRYRIIVHISINIDGLAISNTDGLLFSLMWLQRNYPSATRSSVPEPPETSVATLVSMGFDSNAARQALVRAGNDINVATAILLES